MNFIRKKILAVMDNGIEEVDAQVFGGLAIHRDGPLHWRITHLESGRAFYKKMSYRQAKIRIKELFSTGVNFEQDDDLVLAELAKVRAGSRVS